MYNIRYCINAVSRYVLSYFCKQLEKATLEKKATLILNVDGYIAAMLLDMLSHIWYTDWEIVEAPNIWYR